MFSKIDQKEFEKTKIWFDKQLFQVKQHNEDLENHFAMVENFVEKYIPVRI